MTGTLPAPRLPKAAQPNTTAPLARRFSAQDIKAAGAGLPNRYILYALEKWGKTSFAAQAPKPIFLMTSGETGLLTLIDNGLPETPHFPEAATWEDLIAQLNALIDEDMGYRTLVIDTMNGAEKMCHEYVCQTYYGGDWTDKGFMGFQRGYETAIPEWKTFLILLDKLREVRKMSIFLLCHTAVRNFKNPSGPDFDRYQPEMHKSTWAITNKWVDCILFGAYDTTVRVTEKAKDGTPTRGKGQGGQTRIIYAQRDAAFDAGSRVNLQGEIDMGNSPQEGWTNFMAALKASRPVKQEVAS